LAIRNNYIIILGENTMDDKELSTLDQILVDTIKKSSDASGEIYNATKMALIKGIDFAETQIPDIIEQFLLWHLAESIVWLVVGILFFSGALYLAIKYWRELQECIVLNVAVIVISSITIIRQTLDIVYILVAPKVYIMEYISDIIR
jgi:hypothetical protein